MRTIVWFRHHDLRVADHVPLAEAAASGEAFPLFVAEPHRFETPKPGSVRPRGRYLLDAVRELDATLRALGSMLIVVVGEPQALLPRLAAEWSADRIVAHRCIDPRVRRSDALLTQALDVPLQLFEGETLAVPGTVLTKTGAPHSRFFDYAQAFERCVDVPRPLVGAPPVGPVPDIASTRSIPIPTTDGSEAIRNSVLPAGGENAAHQRLAKALDRLADQDGASRTRLDLAATSGLSADLRFGCLSARQVWSGVSATVRSAEAKATFLRQLIWREFTHDILWHRPDVSVQPFRQEFLNFPWRHDSTGLLAWKQGITGYPVVDAAARQLLKEGFIHNHARRLSAAFLTKGLMVDYREGEAHYLQHLVDGCRASNNFGWQRIAGCGSDAQPYFHVPDLALHGARLDPKGEYVRRWIPELAQLPSEFIHRPWSAPKAILRKAGVQLGKHYPHPIVDPAAARHQYLRTVKSHLAVCEKTGTSTPQVIPAQVTSA